MININGVIYLCVREAAYLMGKRAPTVSNWVRQHKKDPSKGFDLQPIESGQKHFFRLEIIEQHFKKRHPLAYEAYYHERLRHLLERMAEQES